MTHIVQRFERRLRSLTELAPKAHLVAVEKIKEIHRVGGYMYAVDTKCMWLCLFAWLPMGVPDKALGVVSLGIVEGELFVIKGEYRQRSCSACIGIDRCQWSRLAQ